MRIHTHFSLKVKKNNKKCIRRCKKGHRWLGNSNEHCPVCPVPPKKKRKSRALGEFHDPIFKQEWPSLDIQYGWFDGELTNRKKKKFNVKSLQYNKIEGSHLI
jgi:hypothetical protein